MSEPFRVSSEFHEYVKSHKRGDETREETLRRLIGGPDPDGVSGILSGETANAIETQSATKRERSVEGKTELRERFERYSTRRF